MKKLLALILAALMLASFAACSNDDGNENADLKNYLQNEVVVDHEVLSNGETFYFDSIDSETVKITGYEGSTDPHALVIPTTLNNKTVVEISDQAFYYCSNLTSVEIPATVTSIGAYAFAGCSQITSLTIPAAVKSIGEAAFYGCSAMTTLTFAEGSALTEIAKFTFNSCSALTSVSIPAHIKTVGTGAFLYCSALAEVTVADGVEMIGAQAFQNCTALAKLTLPASVKTIGSLAFSGSENLYSNGVTCPAGSAAETFINAMDLTEKPADATAGA